MTSNRPLSESVPSSSAPAATLRPEPRPLPAWVSEVVLPIATVIGLFIVWEAACRGFGVPAYIIPAPSAIGNAVGDAAGNVAMHTLITSKTVLLGFIVSALISLPLAVLLTSSPLVAAAIYPLLVLTQAIPKVALAPILVVVLGTSELPRVVVTFLVAFFPLVLSMAAGLVSVPPELIELGRACKANRWTELWRIRLPYAVPFIFSGLKAAIALAVVGAVVAEFVNADAGLGYLIQTSTAFFKVELAWGALLILSILGIILFQIVVVIERVFFPWSQGSEAPTV
ncbi:MAG TPA: ABC transporter permease [Vineibacter sp.]|nr:ABC transporter permease [Vineibacter sp.]